MQRRMNMAPASQEGLRVLDALLSYPSTILGRHRTIFSPASGRTWSHELSMVGCGGCDVATLVGFAAWSPGQRSQTIGWQRDVHDLL